jgi:hypothetical protein
MSNLENVVFVIKKNSCDGIGNIFKSFITAYSCNPNSHIECNSQYALGVYNTVLAPKHIYDPSIENFNDKEIAYMYTSRLLVLSEEDNEQKHIFMHENNEVNGCGNLKYNYLYSFKCLIDYNYDNNNICNRVKNRILSTIHNIEFLPIINEKVNYNFSFFNNKNMLGISIRTWKCFHEKGIQRPYNSVEYKNKINNIINNHSIEGIVISFDNHNVETEYMDFLSKYDLPIWVLRKSNDINELQHCVIKMLTLSKCNYFIGNRISTFSELVYWFSDCNINCHNVF